MKKKKINKIPRHNAIITYETNNKYVDANINYKNEETDKNLYKDVLRGYDNAIFLEKNIMLAERKFISINGKGILASAWLGKTYLLNDKNDKLIDEWRLRIWKAENYKLQTIGEFSVTYECDFDLDYPDKRWSETSSELFVNNELFETFENCILRDGLNFVKNLRIGLGIHVDKKEKIKNKIKAEGGGYTYGITHYDINFSPKNQRLNRD